MSEMSATCRDYVSGSETCYSRRLPLLPFDEDGRRWLATRSWVGGVALPGPRQKAFDVTPSGSCKLHSHMYTPLGFRSNPLRIEN